VTLAIPKARCASVIDQLRSETPTRVARVDFAGPRPVEVATASDVLYVPALHLQVWRGEIVPDESNIDGDAFPELQLRARTGKIMAHALFTNARRWHEDVCVLSNLFSHNFYHFIEELYKVVILERAGFAGKYVFSRFPSRIASELPRFSLEFLDLLGVAPDRIAYLDRPTLLQSVWYTTRISHADTPSYPGVLDAVREALIGAVCDLSGLGPRLWLERRTFRLLVNAEAVHRCIRRHGFAIVELADLPVARQIAAANKARVLAGPHGAALVHAMFMAKRSTVIECFSPRHINPSVLELCSNLHHRYLQLVQIHTPLIDYKHGGDVEINLRHLELTLQSLEE
jgi:capsular polysaccharide biosynthesis protein